MTNENENQNTNSTPTIKNKYIITDSITKGFLIDTVTTAEVLSFLALTASAVVAVPVSTSVIVAGIIGTSISYGSAASYAYYVRENALEDGNGLTSYALSGATKYGARQIVKSIMKIGSSIIKTSKISEDTKLVKTSEIITKSAIVFTTIAKEIATVSYEAGVGTINNLAYGLCDKKITGPQSDTMKHMCSAIYIEGSESILKAFLEGSKIKGDLPIGLLAGGLVEFNANVIYANAIGHVHTIVDYFYQEPVGQTIEPGSEPDL